MIYLLAYAFLFDCGSQLLRTWMDFQGLIFQAHWQLITLAGFSLLFLKFRWHLVLAYFVFNHPIEKTFVFQVKCFFLFIIAMMLCLHCLHGGMEFRKETKLFQVHRQNDGLATAHLRPQLRDYGKHLKH